MTEPDVSRRNFMVGTVVTVAAGVAGYVAATKSSYAKDSATTTAANNYGYTAPPQRRQVGTVSAIPEGGAVIVKDQGMVLTRDDAGQVHAFSAHCTHQGCVVTDVRNGQIICPCHGSRFAISNGHPTAGPARRPLPTIDVTVEGDAIYAAPGG